MQKSISILLPTYNCTCVALVRALQAQCVATGIDFEILVADDASTDKSCIVTNRAIEALEGVRYIVRNVNVGRSAIRNFLVNEASKEWLLFIDGDLSLDNPQLIRNYLDADGDVIVGGLKIGGDENVWKSNLRYRYERASEEQINAINRAKRPYQHLSTNFMVRKTLTGDHPYNTNFKRYGYEDVLLGKDFQRKKLKVRHIDNAVLFDSFEPNDVFIAKTEESLRTLYHFKSELNGYSKLLAMAEKINRLHCVGAVSFLYKLTNKPIKRQLQSNNPSVFLFNIYKLMYYCTLPIK